MIESLLLLTNLFDLIDEHGEQGLLDIALESFTCGSLLEHELVGLRYRESLPGDDNILMLQWRGVVIVKIAKAV